MSTSIECRLCGDSFEGEQKFRLHCKREHKERLKELSPSLTVEERYNDLKATSVREYTKEELAELDDMIGEKKPTGITGWDGE